MRRMDEFLRGIHTALFKEWILNKKIKGCKIKENNNKIILTTHYCHGEVIFNPHDLIELSVTNLINDKIEFYLHFHTSFQWLVKTFTINKIHYCINSFVFNKEIVYLWNIRMA